MIFLRSAEEVTEEVTRLHKPVERAVQPITDNLGCSNATFVWSETAADPIRQLSKSSGIFGWLKPKKEVGSKTSTPDAAGTPDSAHKAFELQDLNVSCELGLPKRPQ